MKTEFKMQLPNLSMKSIYMDYFNQLNQLTRYKDDFIDAFESLPLMPVCCR